MTARVRKPRPQSARLDILSAMAASVRPTRPTSPTDSLSPCREDFKRENPKAADRMQSNDITSCTTSITGPDGDDWFESETAGPMIGKSHVGLTDEAGSNDVQQEQHLPLSPQRQQKHSTPAVAAASHASLRPRDPPSLLSRSHRPATLNVGETSGATTLPVNELKQAIQQNRSIEGASQASNLTPRESSSNRGRPSHRTNPALQPKDRAGSGARMGNQHSHNAFGDESAFDDSDARSTHSGHRQSRLKAARLPRRSSMNVFKRFDAKSPLPPELSGTVIEVPRAATAPNLDGMGDDDEYNITEEEQERSRARHAHRHSAPSPAIQVRSDSPTATLTEESAARPLSETGTITDRHPSTQVEDFAEEDAEEGSPTHLRISALSPTLPAPSPIPEDSPHKYGLKDRVDTPEAADPPPEIEITKATRRSSGLAIFNVSISPSEICQPPTNNQTHRKPKRCNLPPLS